MVEKLCLRWNDFQDIVKNAFGHLRASTDFVDVTLACEDGQQIEAHKMILAASSPFPTNKDLSSMKHAPTVGGAFRAGAVSTLLPGSYGALGCENASRVT